MQKRKIYIKLLIGIVIAIMIFLCSIKLIDNLITKKSAPINQIDFSYYEDHSKSLQLEEIKKLYQEDKFIINSDDEFRFGRSDSVIWISISAKKISDVKSYIALHCPNIQDVTLYYRTDSGVCVKTSGWENSYSSEDEDMTYPVFGIQDIGDENHEIYLRIASIYSHIYNIKFFDEEEFLSAKKSDYFMNSSAFSILFTIIILNLCAFFVLKSKVSLYFGFSILFLCANQGCTTGFYNLLLGKHAKWLMQYSIEFGFLYFISIIVFFMYLSEVRIKDKRYYQICKGLIAGCLVGSLLCFYNKVTANLFAHALYIVEAIFIMYASLRMSLRREIGNVFFLMGWSLTHMFYTLVILSAEGILHLESDLWGFHSGVFMTIIIAAIFTVASIRYTRTIQTEYFMMQHQVKATTEKIKRTENVLLQTQIKPHFLYNTLTAIEQLCEIDSKLAQRTINDFAYYLRNNIDFSMEAGLIPIEKEIENVKCYLSLEKTRFEERLQIVYDIADCSFNVPPLVVQPMVENAVRHGITKKRDGGTVTVRITEEELNYEISIIDDGIGFDMKQVKDVSTSHIGIDNARERIERLSQGMLEIISSGGKGTKVIITIPKEQM